ncbi:MAG: hypothetical protein ABJM06_14925 [Gilvibacter sp.]
MKKYLPLLVLMLLANSCGYTNFGLRNYKLQNGYSRAATNPKVYANRVNFNTSLLAHIDTLVIYEEYVKEAYFGLEPTQVNAVARKNYQDLNPLYGVYRFYGNGYFNYFILNRENDTLTKQMFDPKYGGWRGVYYAEDNIFKGDLITQISGDGAIGIVEQVFEFSGDTMFVHSKKRRDNIYLKRKIPIQLLNFKADW